jgi:hypothetical protein
MTEEQLRDLVREIVAERIAAQSMTRSGSGAADCKSHSSHTLLRVLPGAETGGACLIEPAVRCNLCGYCQSLGH